MWTHNRHWIVKPAELQLQFMQFQAFNSYYFVCDAYILVAKHYVQAIIVMPRNCEMGRFRNQVGKQGRQCENKVRLV